jgi:hypothetical protein
MIRFVCAFMCYLVLTVPVLGATHADTVVITNATKIKDNTYNYGASTTLTVYNNGSASYRTIIWGSDGIWDTASVLHAGVALDSQVYIVHCTVANGATVAMYQLYAPTHNGVTSYEGTMTSEGADTVEAGTITGQAWYSPDSLWRVALADSTKDGATSHRLKNGAYASIQSATSASTGWINSANVTVDDGSYATLTTTLGAPLLCRFTVAIPATSVVDSIKITANVTQDGDRLDQDMDVTLNSGSTNGTRYTLNGTSLPQNTDTTVSITHTLTDWGMSGLTVANINAGGTAFRVALRKSPVDWIGTAKADCVYVTIYYRAYGPDRTATAIASKTITDTGWVRFSAGTDTLPMILLETTTTGITVFNSDDDATAALRPKIIFYSHDPGGNLVRRRKLLEE